MAEHSSLYENKIEIKKVFNILNIITMYYYDFTATYNSNIDYHEFWEFVYVDNGHVIAMADDNYYKINKGEIIFHKPNEKHSVKCDGITPANIFIMTFVCRSSAMKYFNNKILTVPHHLQSLLASIVEEMQLAYGGYPGPIKYHPTRFGSEQMIKNYLELFLISLYRVETDGIIKPQLYYHDESTKNKLVSDVIEILKQNIYNSISIQDICTQTNYGKSHLCEQFKSKTGKTIIEYHTILKINEAKMLLRKQNTNSTQISDLLGFSSPQYFTRVFKKLTNMTPAEYKSSAKYK